MAAKAGRSDQLEFRNNRQTANSNLPCTPLLTPKDTRPRFCNPSSLSSHSYLHVHTYRHRSAQPYTQVSTGRYMHTYTHICVQKWSYYCAGIQKQGRHYLSPSHPSPQSITLPPHLPSSRVLLTIPISLTPTFKFHATIPLRTSHWPLFLRSVEPLA